jgi:WD40 repeat protein
VLFDSTVSVWDLDTLECRHRLQRWGDRNALHVHSSAVNAGYLAVNATNAVTVSKDSTARVWDLDTGSCIHVLLGINRRPASLSSPILRTSVGWCLVLCDSCHYVGCLWAQALGEIVAFYLCVLCVWLLSIRLRPASNEGKSLEG